MMQRQVVFTKEDFDTLALRILEAMWEVAQEGYGIRMQGRDGGKTTTRDGFIGTFICAVEGILTGQEKGGE